MIVQRPTPDQERWLRITARLALPRLAPEVAARTGGWKSVAPLARSALFVLGIVAAALSLVMRSSMALDAAGIGWAIASGALASGVGYAIWYTALGGLSVTSAASVQLSVPVIAALGGIVLLGEPLTLRLVIASSAILGGIALVIARPPRAA